MTVARDPSTKVNEVLKENDSVTVPTGHFWLVNIYGVGDQLNYGGGNGERVIAELNGFRFLRTDDQSAAEFEQVRKTAQGVPNVLDEGDTITCTHDGENNEDELHIVGRELDKSVYENNIVSETLNVNDSVTVPSGVEWKVHPITTHGSSNFDDTDRVIAERNGLRFIYTEHDDGTFTLVDDYRTRERMSFQPGDTITCTHADNSTHNRLILRGFEVPE